MKKADKEEIFCSFCESPQEEINLLIEGNNVYICDLCIEKASEVIAEDNKNNDNIFKTLKPAEIKKELDKHIITQDKAKKVVSVAVYNHYKRIMSNLGNDIIIDKSNILLVGPTGTGKTLLAKTLASILNVPFAIVDATVLTEAGYVGEDVENILVRLYHDSNYDLEKTEQGIIYIDEIDKISRKSANPSITRDVSGEGVQQSLLKIIEGTIASVPPEGGRKHPEQPLVKINTSNILFICGGTFDGIENIIEKRMRGGSIGFDRFSISGEDPGAYLNEIKPEDIIKYGFLPELMGRLPLIAALNYLNKKSLKQILTHPVNCIINQYKHLFKIDNVELVFDKNALEAIVDVALERKTGARALRSVLEEVMVDIMFDIPSKKNLISCEITKDVILNNKNPKLKFYKKTA